MISLLLATLAAQDALEPARHPWMAWKPGAVARYRIDLELGSTRQEGGIDYSLIETGPRGYRLKVVAAQLNQELTSEQKDDAPVRAGADSITVEGKDVSTTSWSSRGVRGGLVSETRLWLRPEGGAPLKMTSKIDGQEDLTLTAAALEEVVKAAGREIRCVRLEGRDVLKNHQVTAWFSPEVPGGLVKMVTRAKRGGQDLVSTLELTQTVDRK